MQAFTFEQLPMRVVFAAGAAASIGDEVRRCGAKRAMVIHDAIAKPTADDVAEQLGSLLAARWDEVAQHVPVPLAERARAAATNANIDLIVCIGGGSSTGLAKAIALTHHVPIVAVPTTYAGSEQTTIYGLTDTAHKQTGKDPAVLPRVVVYDPELTLGLPAHVTGPSAFNALAHSVEGLYATGCNPITSALALEAVRAIARSLPLVMHSPRDVDARGDLMYGAALSGMALGATSAGLHHKICHVLGGMFNLVHADAHSVVLPHAIAFNAPALPEEMERLAEALGAPGGDPAALLWDLAVASKVPTKLADLVGSDGPLQRDDLEAVAKQAAGEIKDNPRPVSASDLLELLQNAFDGTRP
ncbi:MAG: maleylacetate reductase [Ilumatobacteraceae bacterium]